MSYIIMKNISNMVNICINITIAVAILAQVIIDDNFKNLLPNDEYMYDGMRPDFRQFTALSGGACMSA